MKLMDLKVCHGRIHAGEVCRPPFTGHDSNILSPQKIHYCIKRTLPVRYRHELTGESRAFTVENVYMSVNLRAMKYRLCMFNIIDLDLPREQKLQRMINLPVSHLFFWAELSKAEQKHILSS